MIHSDNRLFCRIDGQSGAAHDQQRQRTLAGLDLLDTDSVPVFEEATQTAAHFLDVPICCWSLLDCDQQRFKSAVGLARLGLMNPLATHRQLPRAESFCSYVVDSQQPLAIEDTRSHPTFATSPLTQQYGVRAYLGVPLITSQGCCIGTLAVMDLVPRRFTTRDIEFLGLTARWSLSEYERQQTARRVAKPASLNLSTATIANQLKVELLSQLTQELRTPLTAVMGMASVLTREIYGPLTLKQREYLDIVHRSGHYLLSLVNEILELSALQPSSPTLSLTAIDLEMLCQQTINTLQQAAQRRDQTIRLTIEPGRRVWLLDKAKVRQLLYHLLFSVIQVATAGSIVRLHVSRRDTTLQLTVWLSHPWLGEGLPPLEWEHTCLAEFAAASPERAAPVCHCVLSDSALARPSAAEPSPQLGLALCHQLAELHEGQLAIQGSPEGGYRYVVSLPQFPAATPR